VVAHVALGGARSGWWSQGSRRRCAAPRRPPSGAPGFRAPRRRRREVPARGASARKRASVGMGRVGGEVVSSCGSASRSKSCSGSTAQAVYFHLPSRSATIGATSLGGVFHRHRRPRAAPPPAAAGLSPSVQGATSAIDTPARSPASAARRGRDRRRRPAPGQPGRGDHQRHAGRALEEAHLEPQPALAQHVAVVRDEDDDRLLPRASSTFRISPILSSR
jgi:hypothetical protein